MFLPKIFMFLKQKNGVGTAISYKFDAKRVNMALSFLLYNEPFEYFDKKNVCISLNLLFM